MGKRKRNENGEPKPEDFNLIPINGSASINFKPYIESIDEPIFPSLIYCIQSITTNNTLTITNEELSPYLMKNEGFYICQTHGLSEQPHIDCVYCTPFLKFNYVFILKTKYHYLSFPPPNWYSPKVLNFLKTFSMKSFRYLKSTVHHPDEAMKEISSYALFVNMGFTEGSLKSLSTGKTSYIRNCVLGFHTFGGRATLSIDSTLSPQYVILPQQIYDNLNLACPIVIINRSPSLKNTCIYGVEAIRNEDSADYTIRMNSYVSEGLHADQDGDELSIFYIKHPGKNIPSHNIKMAIVELKKFCWNGGIRHDFKYKPRYEFTQYLKYVLYRYNDHFCKHNKLWASIKGDVALKCNKIMHLGCSIYPREVDEFICQLSDFVKNLDVQFSTCEELLNGTGAIKDVVLSGAKGEDVHILTYLNNLYNLNASRTEEMISNFNKYIESGTKMSHNGTYQFLVLEAVNPLTMLNGHVFYNDVIIMFDMSKATSLASYYFNTISVEHIFNYIGNTTNLVTDDEVDSYLRSLK